MTTSQDEAIQILAQVISNLTVSDRDLRVILRMCQHACELLCWDTQKAWFHQELNGYYAQTSIPAYRVIYGDLVWEPDQSLSVFDVTEWTTENMFYGKKEDDAVVERTTLTVWSGVDWLFQASQHGYKENTDEIKSGLLHDKKTKIALRRVKSFPSAHFSAVIKEIEKITFDFASKAYVNLRYGNAIGDIWSEYRKIVDQVLQQINFGGHLESIQLGLKSDNPESWRLAGYACRDLFEDLANYLWQDNRNTYEYLPGRDEKGNLTDKLDVSKGKFKNRLKAYIHQKGVTGTERSFLQDEIERLATSISSLVSFQSKSHGPISKNEINTIALFSYLIIGELIIKTDMKPILKYGEPARDGE